MKSLGIKKDSLFSLQSTVEENSIHVQQLHDKNLVQVLKKVEEQLVENFSHLVLLEKNVEQLTEDMNVDIKVNDKLDKIYNMITNNAQVSAVLSEQPAEVETRFDDHHLMQRVSNRVDTLSRHYNHMNQSVITVMRRQDAIENKMDKVLKKLDELLNK